MSAIGCVVTVSRPFGARAALVAMGVVVAAAPVVRAQPARPPACVAAPGAAQPVVDVHMHAVGAARAGPPADDTMALHAVIAELDRRHVIAVVVSSLALPRALQ